MQRRDFLKSGLTAALAAGFAQSGSLNAAAPLPDVRYDKLPQWRGFNLLEKFNGRNDKFVEDDFRWIQDFGFNFVRLPMDYRAWIVDKDWKKINEKVLEDVDEVVRFGEKYGVHICMNFHRAPGYTVASPPEPKSVWTDPEALEVCTKHWKTFAKRYKGVSNKQVSFNLFNEPGTVDGLLPQCVAAHKAIIKGIREEDADRLIICDGYQWGGEPFFDLADQKIAQATRGYAPSEISHYGASWVNSKDFPYPAWPIVSGNGNLFSPSQSGIDKERQGEPLVVTGNFQSAVKLRIKVGTVSDKNLLTVKADGKTVFEHPFAPGPGEGEWEKVVYAEQWKIYQNVYNRNYTAVIPAGTKKVEVRIDEGQWLILTEIGIQNEKAETSIKLSPSWNQPAAQFVYQEADGKPLLHGGNVKDRQWLRDRLEPWKKLQTLGCGVIVGEFGAHSPCPHDVALRWMSDMLTNWDEADWGYALWNLRGSFGIIDSGRKDVDYEDFHGHKLDRKMLTLLQRKE
ncbi:MAG: glycoside hydrolase family 5 protein [Planctomycetaceae bacterium]|nr:glycoside hydrolase family 5 protein [Planctomycetaceae bacterium]